MSVLDQIVASTHARVEAAKAAVSIVELTRRADDLPAPRGLLRALAQAPDIALIAEIKRATPALGPLAPDLDAKDQAGAYASGGASAISVLTEPRFFSGSLDDLPAAAGAGLPVLSKDFVVDPYQVCEARAHGADAVLVIVRIIEGPQLEELVGLARDLGMDALVEVKDEEDLDRAVAAGADLIGINHRDLATFEVDPTATARLAPRVDRAMVVALSGVRDRAGMVAMGKAGARAALVGEALVTAPDPAAKAAELLGR